MGGDAVLLDVTRLTTRLGRGALTGIDRVEAAYLGHFLGQAPPLYGLLRSKLGYLLLDREGCARLAEFAAQTRALPPLPFWLRPFAKPGLRGALAARAQKIASGPHGALPRLLEKIPQPAIYLNVGHSNLSAPVLQAMQQAGLRRAVMIHDTIPLDFPQFARQGSVAPFAAKIAATARHADLVIHVSQVARAQTEAHFAAHGRVPPGVTAHLGVTLAPPCPAPIVPQRPYFVALGTIEPRKNLALLLDIWEKMGHDDPQLVLLGAKGWADPALFAQIARLQARGLVLHGESLSDGAVVTLMMGALALLFPSFAEGFGLPPIEAAGLGLPVIAADLPVLHETCGAFPVYLDPCDSYSWMETIKGLAKAGPRHNKPQNLPLWADHFKTVLTQLF